jgi:hypothetical protein
MVRAALAAALLLTLGAAPPDHHAERAARDQARLAKSLAGLVPGEPRNCISRMQVTGTETLAGTLLYRSGSRRIFRNDLSPSCGRQRDDDILISRNASSQVCKGDLIEFRERTGGFFTGSCVLGAFVPYTRPK